MYRAVAKGFLLAFMVGGLALALVLKLYSQRIHAEVAETESPPGFSCAELTQTQHIADDRFPQRAKANRRFWAEFPLFLRCSRLGIGVDLLKNEKLFSAVFPGYEFLRADSKWWQHYFSRIFNIDSWVAVPTASGAAEVMVSHSWQGNAEIFEKFGADVLVVGSSQTFRNLLPGILAEGMKEMFPQSNPLRVLFISAPDMLPPTMKFMARELARAKKSARLLILGYTPKMAFARRRDREAQIRARRDEWRPDHGTSFFQVSDWLPSPSWDVIFPVNGARLRNLRRNAQLTYTKGTMIPRKVAVDERALIDWTGEIPRAFDDFANLTNQDCDFTAVKQELTATLQSLRALAPTIAIYNPPATPVYTDVEPQCFGRGQLEMLRQLDNGRETVALIHDWKEHGVDWKDYLHPTETHEVLQLDPVHTNFPGAVKASRGFVRLLSDKLRRLPPGPWVASQRATIPR